MYLINPNIRLKTKTQGRIFGSQHLGKIWKEVPFNPNNLIFFSKNKIVGFMAEFRVLRLCQNSRFFQSVIISNILPLKLLRECVPTLVLPLSSHELIHPFLYSRHLALNRF